MTWRSGILARKNQERDDVVPFFELRRRFDFDQRLKAQTYKLRQVMSNDEIHDPSYQAAAHRRREFHVIRKRAFSKGSFLQGRDLLPGYPLPRCIAPPSPENLQASQASPCKQLPDRRSKRRARAL